MGHGEDVGMRILSNRDSRYLRRSIVLARCLFLQVMFDADVNACRRDYSRKGLPVTLSPEQVTAGALGRN